LSPECRTVGESLPVSDVFDATVVQTIWAEQWEPAFNAFMNEVRTV
jgi:hypothetical protein